MYKKTDPQQSLFSVETQLSRSLLSRLKGSWANLFRAEILPILLKSEDDSKLICCKVIWALEPGASFSGIICFLCFPQSSIGFAGAPDALETYKPTSQAIRTVI
jgi:hypothetical protein